MDQNTKIQFNHLHRRHVRFSRINLAIVVVVFALIGAFTLIQSHAAPNPNLPGDLNNDNTVNGLDLSLLLTAWGTNNTNDDINNDGIVNGLDLSILLSHWGQTISTGDPSTLHSALGFNTLNATSDDFSGSAGSLPSSIKWGAKTFTAPSGTVWGGWSNISEDGQGDLVIKAVKDSGGVWTSGFLTGKAGYSGPRYVEARAKVPCGFGTWSAPVWEWGYPFGAAPMFENDVIEQLGKEPQAYHATLHNWDGGSNPQSGKTINTNVTVCDGFHYYGAAVFTDHVDFYFDGIKMASTASSAIGLSDLASPEEVVNISQNMGGWGGTPTVSSPVTLLVDYIRIYTK